MILKHQNLIYHVLKKMNLYHAHDELYDLGMIGLIKGVDTYNPEKGSQTTYLYRCIYNAILMNFRKKQIPTISIEEKITDNLTIAETVKDNYDFVEDLEKQWNLNQVYKVIDKLPTKEKEILIKYFGLFNTKRYKQKELAKIYNHSQSYIARIIDKAITKIRNQVMYETT